MIILSIYLLSRCSFAFRSIDFCLSKESSLTIFFYDIICWVEFMFWESECSTDSSNESSFFNMYFYRIFGFWDYVFCYFKSLKFFWTWSKRFSLTVKILWEFILDYFLFDGAKLLLPAFAMLSKIRDVCCLILSISMFFFSIS